MFKSASKANKGMITDRDNSASFWDILERLPAAIYKCDAAGYITHYNEAAARLWGRNPLIGEDLWCGSWKTYHLDGSPLPLDECPMARSLKEGKPFFGESLIIEQENGDRFHVLAHPSPIFDAKGILTGAINMLVDITNQAQVKALAERTRALEKTIDALKKSEERYHHMVAEVQDYAIILLSKEGTIENWNKGAEKIKGYSEAEIIGRNFRIFYPQQDRANGLPERLIQEATARGKATHDGWRLRKDGSKFWGSISITALHNDQQEVIGFVKVTRDLTEKKIEEDKAKQFTNELILKNELLRQSEERYHRMVADVKDYAIFLLDVNGNIASWNKGAEKIKGYTAEEIIGRNFSIFYSEVDRQQQVPQHFMAEVLKNGKALHEGWRVRKDGSLFWGSVVLTALYDDNGDLIGFSKVTRDLTERKIAEQKLINSSLTLEKKNTELQRINEELSSFAYISSHDLQEPLRKIQTFSDRILEMEYENLSEKGKDYFHRMKRGAHRMQTLIRDILAYSRTSTADKIFETADLGALLAQSKAELEESIVAKKAVITSDRLPVVKVIPFQIQQLFDNLLNNALKFSKDSVPPQITITCEMVDAETIQLAVPDLIQYYYHITFSDNGIGFDPVYEKKIFEVFQRLHGRSEYGGTGIGLAICKKIVANHRGLIRAEGRLNEGASFHIYLPAES